MKRILPVIVFALLLAACSKSSKDPSTSKIRYVNTTFTPLIITVNGATANIPAGQSMTFTGKAEDSVTMFAQTSGLNGAGNLVGSVVTWNYRDQFPPSDSVTRIVSVPTTYFFLMIKNSSTLQVSGIYVNYGLASQSYDALFLVSGTYNIGYYPAYSNTTVRCVGPGNLTWQSGIVPFTNTENQSAIFTITN